MTVSFLHRGDPTWASYRYRAARPAQAIGASLNNYGADVLVFTKPHAQDVALAEAAQRDGRIVIVDVCDPHFERSEYRTLLSLASAITCPSPVMQDWYLPDAVVIPDPYEYDEQAPHVRSARHLLWFGHPYNHKTLRRVEHLIHPYAVLRVVCDGRPSTERWSPEVLREALAWADAVVLPFTQPWKSVNRAVEAIRSGCLVLAEPSPAFAGLPGVWEAPFRTNLLSLRYHLDLAHQSVAEGQDIIRETYSLDTIAEHWRSVIAMAQKAKAA